MKAAIYIRVSSTEQALEGYSLPAQESLLKTYAETYGHTIFKVYDDPGISGKNIEDRPGLQRLLADAQKGKFELVLIWKLSRLSRSLIDLLQVVELFKQHNISLVSHSEHFDTSTPIGKMLLQLLGSIAEFERNTLIENVRMGMNQRFVSGLSKSSFPFGYIHTEDKKIALDPEKAALVKEVFNRFTSGSKITELVDFLNASGYKNRVGRPWRYEVVLKMLQNEFYLGYVTSGRKDLKASTFEKKEGVHDPVIDQLTFDLVQEKINTAKKMSYVRRPDANQLFSGIVVCPVCGYPLYYVESYRRYNDGKKYLTPVYRCAASNINRMKCSGFSISRNRVDNEVLNRLKKTIESEELYPFMKTDSVNGKQDKNEGRLDAIIAELEENQKVRDRYFSLFESGKVDIEHFSDRINAVLSKIEALQQEYDSIKDLKPASIKDAAEVISDIKTYFSVYEDLTNEERRDILRTIVQKVNLTPDKKINSIEFVGGLAL